jgi:S-adenosylmethionine decarboxylase
MKTMTLGSKAAVHEVPIGGIHLVADMFGCDQRVIDQEDVLLETVVAASVAAGTQVLGTISHKFDPQGVTAIALLAESHLSIHTWPENGYAAVDIFTCGENMNPDKAIEVLSDVLRPTAVEKKLIKRAKGLN